MLEEDDTHVLSLSFAKNEGYKYYDPEPKINRIRSLLNPSPSVVKRQYKRIKMIVKVTAIFVFLGVCYALPVDDHKSPEVLPSVESVPLDLSPVKPGLTQPLKPENPDLKTDASTWWNSWWHHEYPVYYQVQSVPTYTHWHTHW